MKKLIPFVISAIFLAGCGNTMGDIKEAAAGINSKASEAATAISIDVHSIRAIELAIDNERVTINDLFKTILRDVQWHYDEVSEELKITGTWKDNGLFSDQNFSDQQKKDLIENGKVTVYLSFIDNELQQNATIVQMKLHNNLLVDIQDEDVLPHFIDVFKK